jgi:hypothetical protein
LRLTGPQAADLRQLIEYFWPLEVEDVAQYMLDENTTDIEHHVLARLYRLAVGLGFFTQPLLELPEETNPGWRDHLVKRVGIEDVTEFDQRWRPSLDEPFRRLAEQLVQSIDATGGVTFDDKGQPAPEADPDWIDLGHLYLEACVALGRPSQLNTPTENDDDS